MSRISYVNGKYLPHMHAFTHINDRGYQFADGVYEVIGLMNGKMADEKGHLDRLERSLEELFIVMPLKRAALQFVLREVIRRNRLKNAALYIQVTRGVAKRDFKFPQGCIPSLVVSCWPFKFSGNPAVDKGVRAITVPDQRWARRDIKTIALLPQALAKQKAHEAGAYEGIMVNSEGFITEGSSSNFWIFKDGVLITAPKSFEILKGVTRTAVFEIAQVQNIEIIESHFTPEEAYGAQEAFCSSATGLLVPVIRLDEHDIGDGKPGPITQKIYAKYLDYVEKGSDAQIEWTY
ncbi:MAG: D-amino-acid transaminase [Alphaproteobacteria bacterium]